MSIHDNEQLEKRDKRKGSGKQETPWSVKDAPETPQSWAAVEGLLIAYVVCAVSGGGGSVQFTRTQDGGALGVRVYDDKIKTRTEWSRVGEGLEELLYKIGDYYRARAGEEPQRWS